MQLFPPQPFLAALIGLPPPLMLIITLGFLFYIFRRDFRERPNVTWAIWLPTIWWFIIASRPVTQWLSILGLPALGPTSVEEGSPVDALCFFALMALGIYVLKRRQIGFSEILRDNAWVLLFFAYCFIAVFWSDYPFTSSKRWLKIFGHPIMVLILFTEPDPRVALVTLMKRSSYVLFPVSVLWMKYYPSIGRKADEWGMFTNIGITGGKNELGAVCVIIGLFLLWYFLQVWRRPKNLERRHELILTGFLLLVIGYCLRKAHSSTSTISFLLGVLVMLGLAMRFVNKRIIGLYAVIGVGILAAAQVCFDWYGSIIELSGHESTIEGRGHLWEFLLANDTSPIFGTGFESYWLGDRMQNVWAEFRWLPNQAHNGYLEAYINLGAVGLCILIGLLVAAFWKCRQDLLMDFQWGRFTMGCFIAILAHNWTEAGFKGLSVIFFSLFLIMLRYRGLQMSEETAAAPEMIESVEEQEPELIYSSNYNW